MVLQNDADNTTDKTYGQGSIIYRNGNKMNTGLEAENDDCNSLHT